MITNLISWKNIFIYTRCWCILSQVKPELSIKQTEALAVDQVDKGYP